jgi:hypothetical protein
MYPRHNHNPYNGFKDDRERRLALNVRNICYAAVGVAFAMSGDSFRLLEWARGLRNLIL